MRMRKIVATQFQFILHYSSEAANLHLCWYLAQYTHTHRMRFVISDMQWWGMFWNWYTAVVNRISFQTYHSHFLEISHYQMTNRGGHEQSLIKTGVVPLSHHIHRGVHRVLVSCYFGEIKGRALISRSTEKAPKWRGQRTNLPCPDIGENNDYTCAMYFSVISGLFPLWSVCNAAPPHIRPSRRKARERTVCQSVPDLLLLLDGQGKLTGFSSFVVCLVVRLANWSGSGVR